MGKAFLAAFVTLVLGLLTIAAMPNAAELGILVAVVVMGAFIIAFNQK